MYINTHIETYVRMYRGSTCGVMAGLWPESNSNHTIMLTYGLIPWWKVWTPYPPPVTG